MEDFWGMLAFYLPPALFMCTFLPLTLGAALTKNSKVLKWDVEDDEEDSVIISEKSLELRQVC